jgi:hypothetical protein
VILTLRIIDLFFIVLLSTSQRGRAIKYIHTLLTLSVFSFYSLLRYTVTYEIKVQGKYGEIKIRKLPTFTSANVL